MKLISQGRDGGKRRNETDFVKNKKRSRRGRKSSQKSSQSSKKEDITIKKRRLITSTKYMNSSSHDHQPSSHDDHEMENILSQIKDQLSSHLQPSSSQNENEMVVDDEYEMVEISFNPSHDKIIVKFKSKSSSTNQPSSSPVRRSKRKRKNSSHQEEEEENEMVDHETDNNDDYHILNGYISLSSDHHDMVDGGETENKNEMITVMVEGENEKIKEILSSYISK